MALLTRRDRGRHPATRARGSNPMSLRDEMNRMFEDFFQSFGFDSPMRGMGMREFVPAVDVMDSDDEVLVTAELPGMSESDVEVHLEDDVLTIRGEKKQEQEQEQGGRHWRESSYGTFMRQISLPSTIEHDEAEASFRNGVLHVRLPKAEDARNRRRSIPVRTTGTQETK
jgi:HSP20 family protein